jgi:hypothetical protein
MHTIPMSTDDPKPWYRHRWPWFLMAGPATVLVAGSITMWISFSGADALVVDDYYKQGKAINQDLRRDHAAAAIGLNASLRYDAANGILTGQLRGAEEVTPITVLLVHPTVPEKDIRRTVQPNSAGEFSLPVPLLERAHWQVQLEDAGRSWRLNGSWSWPAQQSIDIQPLEESAKGA